MVDLPVQSRRAFVAALVRAPALVIGVGAAGCFVLDGAPAAETWTAGPWLRIASDDSVTIIVDRSEMGQDVTTALAQIVAEELDCNWARVRVEFAPADDAVYRNRLNGAQNTGGSTSVAAGWEPLRRMGAQGRAALIAVAARRWQAGVSECDAREGVVRLRGARRALRYGQLVADARLHPLPTDVALKDPSEYRLVGKPVRRLDVRDRITGHAVFGIDAGPTDALVALVARCPVFGGRPRAWNAAAALRVPGVQGIVPITSGVAVVARGFWAAQQGRAALGVEWDEGPGRTFDSREFQRTLRDIVMRPGGEAGTSHGTPVPSASTIEAVYELPYLAHACMEPMNATAHVRPGACELWLSTQYQSGRALGGGAREVAADLLRLDPSAVTVHTTQLGGGFGRRSMQDAVVDAVEISREARVPVKVIFTRDDDLQHDFYRPPFAARLIAGFDSARHPVSVRGHVACPSILANMRLIPTTRLDPITLQGVRDLPYEFAHVDVRVSQPEQPVPLGFWRSVGHSNTGFVIESFVDEMAAHAGLDPVELRRRLLRGAPRHLRVLELAASAGGWSRALPPGRARGIAIVESYGSVCAQVAEVERGDGGPVIRRVVCAVDCGRVINPRGVQAQVEGGTLFGLGAALFGSTTIEQGAVVEANFDRFRMLRMREAPTVEVHVVGSDANPSGVGEIAVPPIAAAVANAWFSLTGDRIRRLPLTRP